jgi:RNA 3'-terminal phosphate cyclase (ATP)
MITIDGSEGEGGGQILRSALSLSICTAQPFRIGNIRANRDKPGLMRQHLTAVKAAAAICNAQVVGAEVGSRTLEFRPGKVVCGDYSFAIGTAGSSTLVLQTVLPPLLGAGGASVVRISGGTHNRAAPPVDFVARAFLPLLKRMGADVEFEVVRHGFYPRGGGEICARIAPCRHWQPIELLERGRQVEGYAEAYVAALPIHIAERELAVVGKMLEWQADRLKLRGLANDMGPGNAIAITIVHENLTEVFTGFGEKSVNAEAVAKSAVEEARRYLAADAAVGEHLADQLLIPMALGGLTAMSTLSPTQHFESNAKVIAAFTGVRFALRGNGGHTVVTKL